MKLRRQLLTGFGLFSASAVAQAGSEDEAGDIAVYPWNYRSTSPPATQARGGNAFPNAVAWGHTGRKYRFYDDLIRDRVVLLNFMSIAGHRHFEVTRFLVPVAERLGDRLGQDVFMCSVSTDPGHDTPARLRELADSHGALFNGWDFVTSSRNSVSALSQRVFRHGGHSPATGAGQQSSHVRHPMRLIHFGNGGAGLWGACGADSDPDLIVQRLTWVQRGKPVSGKLRRAGPRKIGSDFTSSNREPKKDNGGKGT